MRRDTVENGARYIILPPSSHNVANILDADALILVPALDFALARNTLTLALSAHADAP
jgi:hypothetical protein